MGDGYGSECHLLRWMGRHRNAFDRAVKAALKKPSCQIEWVDFHFQPQKRVWSDDEQKGLDFISENAVRDAWKRFWPQTGNVPNWDAVGRVRDGESSEWLLVEAKANLSELRSQCKAIGQGRDQIRQVLESIAGEFGVANSAPWLTECYQMANRLAVLHFLIRQGVPARLLLVYFVGDLGNSSRRTPQRVEDWKELLEVQDRILGLNAQGPGSSIHKLFLHVSQPSAWLSPDPTASVEIGEPQQ